MKTSIELFGKPTPVYNFAGFDFPRYMAILPSGPKEKRISRRKAPVCGPYQTAPRPLDRDTETAFFYLESDFMPGLRWAWCDEVPGQWDETEEPPCIDHTGWFVSEDQAETVRGLVFKLPKGRGFLAGWALGEGMGGELDRTVYPDIVSAGFAADSMAESIAENEREREREQDEGE